MKPSAACLPVAAVIACLALTAVNVSEAAQRSTAIVSGIVLDPGGAPVVGSTIYLTEVATLGQLEFVTAEDGRFEFSGLTPGRYRLSSTTSGFPRVVEVMLEAGKHLRREITLSFGPFREAWQIVPSDTPVKPRGGQNADWGCAPAGLPFCGPPSLVAEFERDEREQLAGVVVPPRRLRTIPMAYPRLLRDKRLAGRIVVEGRVGTDGVLREVRVSSSDDAALIAATLEALADVRWEPARLRGEPLAVPLTIAIRYVLESEATPDVR